MTELKPCPFCGKEPVLSSLGNDKQNWMIYCSCGLAQSEMGISGETLDEIKTSWNNRSIPADGWIDVKERLPKLIDKGYAKSTRVLACWGSEPENVGEMEFEERIIKGKTIQRFRWNNILSPWEVTHWQPLPEPPNFWLIASFISLSVNFLVAISIY